MPIKLKSRRLCLLVLISIVSTLTFAQRPEPLSPDSAEIEVLMVRENIYLIATGGSNIVVQLGEVGAVVIDSGNPEVTEQVIATLQELTEMPPRYLINTNVQSGHIAGNKAIKDIGQTMPGVTQGLGMPIIGHQNVFNILISGNVPYELWPNNTFFGAKKSIYVNGEAIEILHQPAAITQGDIMVHFLKSDVLVTGDIFITTSYPHFDSSLGGSLQGEIDALNRILDITVPAFNQQGGTLVIPGHGRISSESDVVEYRDMLTIIRDRVRIMINDGLTFEEILAAQPSLEYDGIFGVETGSWTTRMFLEAVYMDLR